MIKSTLKNEQSAFTLIELMMTIVIMSIIAAIAVPNYQKYVVRNAESEAISQIKILEIQLEKWKSLRLTYRGFTPSRSYDETNNIDVYVPRGSTSADYNYIIKVADDNNASLVTNATMSDLSIGRSWKMVAIPNPTGVAKDGFKYIVTSSNEVQCKTKDPALVATSDDCDSAHSTTEQW